MNETLKRAAELLRYMSGAGSGDENRSCNDSANELDALAKQIAEPVAWIDPENLKAMLESEHNCLRYLTRNPRDGDIAIYTIPPDAARRIAELEAAVRQSKTAYEITKADCKNLTEKVIPNIRTGQDERIAELEAERDRWIALYQRAVNEANGLTNYVEDRPELRRAEKALTVIEAEARAVLGRYS